MGNTALLMHYLLVGSCLFGIGIVGFLSRRDLIVMFLSVELMLQGVAVNLVGWGGYRGQVGGQVLVLFIIAVAAAEAAIALALVLNLVRAGQGLDVLRIRRVREDVVTAAWEEEPAEVAEVPEPAPQWPVLPQAGKRPEIPEDLLEYRPSV